MTALVEDLLLLARLDSGRPLDREPVDLTRLLLEAVSDARVLAPEHRWRLELPEDGVEVSGDELRLHQVVTNLLTNARKYTPPGTTVTVTAHAGGFDVRDDGRASRRTSPGTPSSGSPAATWPDPRPAQDGRRRPRPRPGPRDRHRPRGRRHPGHRPRRHHPRGLLPR